MTKILDALLHGEVPSSLLMPRDAEPLAQRQRDVLVFVAGYIEREQVSPSMREVCRHFGWTGIGSVQRHYTYLRKKGYIAWQSGEGRGVRLTPLGRWWWAERGRSAS